jgi:transposase
MGKYQADVNGAIYIADRPLSGKSRFREHEDDDDSAEDVAGFPRPQAREEGKISNLTVTMTVVVSACRMSDTQF